MTMHDRRNDSSRPAAAARPARAGRRLLLAAVALAVLPLLQCSKHHGGSVPPVPTPPPPSGAGGTISGTLRYTNKLYNRTSGFTGATELLPVRHAEVEIVLTPNTSAGTGVTDENGHFSIPISNYGTWNMFVRVYARRLTVAPGVPVKAVVMNNTSSRAVYTAASTAVSRDTSVDQVLDLDIPLASSSAFNIFDVGALGFQYLNALDAAITDPPLLTFYWQTGSTDGTYTDTSNNSIHLFGQTSDSDDFDDDIILHEIGHYVAVNFAKDDSPGGSHTLIGHYIITLTWSEGWAHFWSAAARKWANTNVLPSGRYLQYVWQVDTFGPSSFSAWEIGTPSYFPLNAYGADNEVSVAAFLWDVATGAADSGTLDLGDGPIWNVVHTLFAARYSPLTNERFVTLEDFRDEWTAAYTGAANDIGPVLLARGVLYTVDANEGIAGNDTPLTATTLDPLPSPTGVKTLTGLTFFKGTLVPPSDTTGTHPVGDEDWFSFNVAATGKTYVIETMNLRDGADTYLRVYNATLTVMASNDDRSATDLSSLITFTPTVTGTYYIQVTPYPGNLPGATPYPAADQVATYGSCDLVITVQ
jgi:hypothetical protein